MSECSRCGECCTRLGAELTATNDDLDRWIEEGRNDILQYAGIFEWDDHHTADLWISPTTGEEVRRCPFVRKGRDRPTYKCLIHDTKPEVCRDYKPDYSPGSICIPVSELLK